MWSDTVRKRWTELETAVEKAGGYLAPPIRPIIMDYDYRAMSRYATKKGIKPIELTEHERDLFKLEPPLVYD
jgi:hypothetical protein